ncbi:MULTISPECIES: hypothetical protein [unclassified Limnobacter]|uniref:hypothetical protein n=1 Tax=unclassified Limnobacter TaxID=2630203 RepID=UPI0025C64785|nr:MULTISPECIES: hypothetical protein [unclassified Limnobacter]
MAKPPGFQKHGKTYRVQKAIPKDLRPLYGGKQTIFRKIDSIELRSAAAEAWRILAALETEFEARRKGLSPTGNLEVASGDEPLLRDQISSDEISQICEHVAYSILDSDETSRRDGTYSDDWMFDHANKIIIEGDSWTRQALSRGVYPEEMTHSATEWLYAYGFSLDPNGEHFKRFMFKFAAMVQSTVKARIARNQGEYVPTPDAPSKPFDSSSISEEPAGQSGVVPSQSPASLVDKTISFNLRDLVEEFLELQDRQTAMYKKYSAVLHLLVEYLRNPRIDRIKQVDIEKYLEAVCRRIPPRWRDHLNKGQTLTTLLQRDWVDVGISPKTFSSTYIAALGPFLNHAKRRYSDPPLGYPSFSPNITVSGVKYSGTKAEGMKVQRSLRADELIRLFDGPEMAKFRDNPEEHHKYWLPLIGLYTGARVNEICQLNPHIDIDITALIPHFIFTDESETEQGVRKSVKNETSKRSVPIHPVLIRLGLLDFVRKSRSESSSKIIFSEWPPSKGRASAKAEKWFRGFLAELGIRDETPGKNVSGMHAFRHTFLNRALNLGITNAEVLTGHAGGKSRVVRGYEGELSLEAKLKVLSKLEFDLKH